MRNTTKQKRAAILCALVVLLIGAVYIGILLGAAVAEQAEELIVILVIALYVLIIGAVIVGVLAALRQRLKEIDGGEEEDAKQY